MFCTYIFLPYLHPNIDTQCHSTPTLVYTIPLASSSRILALYEMQPKLRRRKHTPEGLGNCAPPCEYPQCCLPRGRESRPAKGMSTLYYNLQSAEGTIPQITSGWNINHETPFPQILPYDQ